MKTYRKGINERVFHGWDWTDRMRDGDTIESSVWTVGIGLTVDSSSYDQTSTEIEVSGGTPDATYRLTNEVETADQLVYERSFNVMVVDR